jgi:AcrR family transcriptional regulator
MHLSAGRAVKTNRGDRRVLRTRAALTSAFTRLVFRDGYEAVSVGGVAAEANVGRSTFYAHFDGKEDVLKACIAQFLTEFAQTVRDETPPAKLTAALEHMWTNRRLTDAIFVGPPRAVLSRALAEMIEGHLAALARGAKPLAPLKLAATQLAEAQLTLLVSWLKGKARCAPADLAAAMHASSHAATRGLLFGMEAARPIAPP